MKQKLAIITTHPIQYYAPIFRLLHHRGEINIKVFYTLGEGSIDKFDTGFGKKISWDIPLLDGYPFEWAANKSTDPGSHYYRGIITPDLTDRIDLWKPDAVLVFGWAYQSHLKAIRYFKNKLPVYFRGDSTLLNKPYGAKSFFKKVFLTWVYSHINHAFYVGTNNKAYFKRYGLKDNELSFTPHAIDNERFGIDRSSEVYTLRNKLGMSNNDIIILFAGKFEMTKSPMLLLEAFLLLKKPGIHLLFVGNGALETMLREKAAENQKVHFMNFQNQSIMPVIYQACDTFCLPSAGETWGLAINEAMACKKPIIASDRCGCAIDLVKKENGIIFKSGDVDALYQAITKLTDDKTQLIELGKHSATLIKDWNFEQIAAAIEAKCKRDGSLKSDDNF